MNNKKTKFESKIVLHSRISFCFLGEKPGPPQFMEGGNIQFKILHFVYMFEGLYMCLKGFGLCHSVGSSDHFVLPTWTFKKKIKKMKISNPDRILF